MKNISSIFYQYRDTDFLYTFKLKNGQVVMKISDIASTLIRKIPISNENWKKLEIPAPPSEKSDVEMIPWLVDRGYVPSQRAESGFISIKQAPNDFENPFEVIKALIASIEPDPKVLDKETVAKYLCPITLGILENPVRVTCGHAFENVAIQSWVDEGKTTCPECRQKIDPKNIIPDFRIKSELAKLKTVTIPTLSSDKDLNPALASQMVATGGMLEDHKQYQKALNSYVEALNYTNGWRDYGHIPPVFEKLNQKRNAAITYLYLAEYQWKSNEVALACASLENALRLYPGQIKLLRLLAHAWGVTGDREKEKGSLLQIGKWYEKENKGVEAIQMYRRLIQQDQGCMEAYECLIPLLPTLNEKVHFHLMKALFQFRKGNRLGAEEACKAAFALLPLASFELQFPLLSLRASSRSQEPLKNCCLQLAKSYEMSRDIRGALSCYKVLLSIEESDEYFQKVIEGCTALKKTRQLLAFSLRLLNRLVAKEEWEQAEKVALEALKQSSEPLPILQTLEQIYTTWGGHKLSQLWIDLGKSYEGSGELEAAAATYRKAFDRFNGEEHLLALAEVLAKQGKVQEAVELYFQTAAALEDGDLKQHSAYVDRIRKIDPSFSHIPESQRTIFRLSSQVGRLTKEVEELSSQKLEKKRSKKSASKPSSAEKKEKKAAPPPSIEEKRAPQQKSNTELFSEWARAPGRSSEPAPPPSIEEKQKSDTEIISEWARAPDSIGDLRPTDSKKTLVRMAPILSLCALPDGRFASCSADFLINIWDPGWRFKAPSEISETTDYKFKSLKTESRYGELSLLSNNLLLGRSGNHLQIWKIEKDLTLVPVKTLENQNVFCELLNGSLATANSNKTDRMSVWETEGRFGCTTLPAIDDYTTTAIRRLFDNDFASIVKEGGHIIYWRNGTAKPPLCLKGGGNIQDVIVLNPQGGTVATAFSKTIRIFKNIRMGGPQESNILDIEGHTGNIKALCSLRNHNFATSSEDKTIKIWNESGNLVKAIKLGSICEIFLLLSNGLLACGTSEGKIFLLDPAKQYSPVRLFDEHKEAITALIEQNGRLISSSMDKSIKIWSLK